MKKMNFNFFHNNLNKIFVIMVFVLLIFFNIITYRRLWISFVIFIVILIYSRILRYVRSFYGNYDQKFKYFTTFNDYYYLKKLIDFIYYLNLFKNPVLYIFDFLELSFFDFLRKCKNSKKLWFLWFIIINFIFNPVKIFYFYFYRALERWRGYTLKELLYKRIEGLTFSILIYTNIINILLYATGRNYYVLCIWVYVFLVLINFLNEKQLIKKEVTIFDIKFNFNLKISVIVIMDEILNNRLGST